MAKGVVTVDIDKAKDIYREVLRSVRKPVLEDLDVQFMRAVETGNTAWQAEIAAKKQELRDLPANTAIDDVKKPEEFLQIFPDILKPE